MQSTPMLERDNTFDNILPFFEYCGFDVLDYMFDDGEDDGDDGGFGIFLSTRTDKLYVHVLRINYNITLNEHVMSETDLRGFPDYLVVESVEDAKIVIKQFVQILDILSDVCEKAEENDTNEYDGIEIYEDYNEINTYISLLQHPELKFNEIPLYQRMSITQLSGWCDACFPAYFREISRNKKIIETIFQISCN